MERVRPLIRRVYEVEREIPSSGGEGKARVSEGTRRAESRASPAEALETWSFDGESDGEAVLPFVGRIAGYVPGVSITTERILTLDEDLHLADHAFVHAGVKPLSASLPVVPLTMSLEIMAETAACLAPSFGLIGFEDVKATRWIELADTDKLHLRIKAKIAQFDARREVYQIATTIHVKDLPAPAVQSCVLFAPQYSLDLSLSFKKCQNFLVHSLSGEQIYENNYMFHGPIYRGLTGQILLHDRGAASELLVQAPTYLFRSTRRPQLLTDPALLDAVGQLLGIWASEQRERQVFPIGIKKLELYRSTPPAGTRVPVRVEITREEAKTLYADVEIQDGEGAVWLRIKDWGVWKFRWQKRLVDFRRLPTRYPLSRPISLPELAPNAVCCMVVSTDVAGFDPGLLARFYLHMDEMWAFTDKWSFPRRQQHWLLGRVAAKDAVRAWLAQQADAEEMLHPAALVIENDQKGLPQVVHGSTRRGLPKLSISHCEHCAIAIAHSEAVSVDIEPVRPRARAFLKTIATDAEWSLLCGCGSESVDLTSEWITRLWCAKEAAGKLLGTGMNGSPRAYKIQAFSPDGVMHMVYRDSSRAIVVRTLREQEFIIAYAGSW